MSMDRRSRAEIRKLGQAIATDGLEPGTWVLCEASVRQGRPPKTEGKSCGLGGLLAVRTGAVLVCVIGPDAMDMEAKEDGT